MTARSPDLTSAIWRKGSRSTPDGQNCVEVTASFPGMVAVRDSKDPDGRVLSFTLDEWNTFLARIRTTNRGS
jgi:hypothetical protein